MAKEVLYLSKDRKRVEDKQGKVVYALNKAKGKEFYSKPVFTTEAEGKICLEFQPEKVCISWNENKLCLGWDTISVCVKWSA